MYIFYYFPSTIGTVVTKLEKDVTITDTGIADAVEKVYDSVVVVNTFRRTCHRGIHAVICGNEIACRLEFGTAFGFVWRIRHAVGAIAYVYAFTATAVSFVVAAFFESAFNVFHNVGFSLLKYLPD